MRRTLAVLLTSVVAQWSSISRAQAVSGAGADATPIPKGVVRITVAGTWDDYNRVYADTGARRLLGTLATSSLGTQRLPQLSGAEQAIRALTGSSTFALSLGVLEATGDVRQSITPFALDIGLTNRLSIGVVVPYVESHDNALLIINRAGSGATVGQNPAYSSTLGATARTLNGTVLRQLAAARAQLTAEITRCADVAATNCDAIRANPTAAQQLLTQTSSALTALVTVYGDSVRGGSPVVPIVGSATQAAVAARLAALRTSFIGYGISTISDGLAPAAATVINGPAAAQRIVGDSAYGLNYKQLTGTRRAGIGDIDLTATFLWLNTLGARPVQWLNATGFGVRSQVTGGFRFGTAGADRTDDAFDVPIGDGANALLARSTTDVVFNRWFWMSGTVRLVQPFADKAVLRQPLASDSAIFAPSIVNTATRTLGRRVEIEIAPRFVIGRFFGVSGGYLIRRHDADAYAFDANTALKTDAQTIHGSNETYQAYLVGLTFSTLASYVRNLSKWPVEVSFVHTEPLTGTGNAPAVATDRLALRIYTGFPRR